MRGHSVFPIVSLAPRMVLLAHLAAFLANVCSPATAVLLRSGARATTLADANNSAPSPAAFPVAAVVIPPLVPQPPPPILPCYDAGTCAEMKVAKTQAYCKQVPSAPMCKLLTSCPPGGCLNGKCENGYCQCKEGFYGPACQIPGGGKVDLGSAKYLTTAPDVPPPFMPLRETPGTFTYERLHAGPSSGPSPGPAPMASAWMVRQPEVIPPAPAPAPVPIPAIACDGLAGNYDIGGGTLVPFTVSAEKIEATIPGGGKISGVLAAGCTGTAFFPGANTPMKFEFKDMALTWSNGIMWPKAPDSAPGPAPGAAPAPAAA